MEKSSISAPRGRRSARAAATTPISRLQRILVPMDFSGKSRQALRYALPIAEKFDARIILLHVVEMVPVTAPEMAVTTADMRPAREQAQRHLKELATELVPENRLERTLATIGHPAFEILAVAEKLKVDMIVLSTRGRSGLKRFFIGSTAEQVVRHATCPVLSVRRK